MRQAARVIDAAAHLRGKRSEVTPGAVGYLNRRGTYSIRRAREMLGYEPAHDLEAGMHSTEAWLRSVGLL